MDKIDANYLFGQLEYYNARVIHTAVELRVFDELAARPLPASTLAKKIGTESRATELLLNALVALKILNKRGNTFANTPVAKKHLVSKSEEYLGNMIMHASNNWESWMKLPEAIRTGKPVRVGDNWKTEPERHRDFVLAMHDSSRRKAGKISQVLDFRNVFSLLDVGGGPGTYSVHFCKQFPWLNACILDLPNTVAIATEVVTRYRLRSRISCIAGDFTKDRIPGEYDAVWCSNVIHSYSPAENRRLLKKLHRATNPNGIILIQDFVLNENRTSPLFAARFALNMLLNTDKGSTYTYSEIKDWMKLAGYSKISKLDIELPNEVQIIQGVKTR